MATVTRSSQMTQSGVTGTGEWDSRLDRLLEDLQTSVIPTDVQSRNAQEYREYRLTSRSQINNEPPQTSEEKWVEIGNLVGGGPISSSSSHHHHHHNLHSSESSNFRATSPVRFGGESKSVAFADQSSSKTLSGGKMLPVSSSTSGSYNLVETSHSPKIERKEFYSKASYTTMIKGSGGDVVDLPSFTTDEPHFPALTSTPISSTRPSGLLESSETRKTYMTSSSSSTEQQRNNRSVDSGIIGTPYRSVTPPPVKIDPLKTPPMIRKMLQSSQKDLSCSHTTTSSSGGYTTKPPPIGGVPLPIIQSSSSTETSRMTSVVKNPAPAPMPYSSFDERSGTTYYSSRDNKMVTENRERELEPIRSFPSAMVPKGQPEQPKRLDELLATFEDSSYSRSTNYSEGSHKSVPYGPGSHPVQPVRSVRIDDNVTNLSESSDLIQRKNITQYQNPTYKKQDEQDSLISPEPSRNVQGPPVFYPPGEMFSRTEEESMKQEMGKGKMKMERSRKEKEKMKSKHSEKGGKGAVPVPVCLPVCCAAPCSIM